MRSDFDTNSDAGPEWTPSTHSTAPDHTQHSVVSETLMSPTSYQGRVPYKQQHGQVPWSSIRVCMYRTWCCKFVAVLYLYKLPVTALPSFEGVLLLSPAHRDVVAEHVSRDPRVIHLVEYLQCFAHLCRGVGRGGGGAYSFVACLCHLTIDHASLSRRSTVLLPVERRPTFGRSSRFFHILHRDFLLILSPCCFVGCGHHLSPTIAIVFSLISSVPGTKLFHVTFVYLPHLQHIPFFLVCFAFSHHMNLY